MALFEHAAGIDVSHYKKRIEWKKVAESGVQFAIIKATEADNFVDSRFDYNWTRTRKEGIIRGAYHFFRPLVDPVRQANHFMKIAGKVLHGSDLPPVLDVESYPAFIAQEWKQISLNERYKRLQVWLQTVEAATGRVPIIYTEYYAWYEYIGNTEKFVRYPLWIANYRVEKPKVPANNWGGKGWTFWQTTEKGVVPGIRDEAPCVDLDVYRGTFEELESWLKIEQPRPKAPEVTNGDMMAALVDTADILSISTDDLVNRAGLKYLVDPIGNSLRPYDGDAVSELPLSKEEKRVLSKELEKFIGANASAWSITHQDLINAFYYAASKEGVGGWTLVERAGLDYIGKDREALYNGPVLDELTGLTQEQKDAIAFALGITFRPVEELPEEGITPVEEPVDEPVNELVEEGVETIDEIEAPTPEPLVEEEEQEQDTTEQVEPADPPGEISAGTGATYGNEVDNQAMINAFYLAAIKLDQNGREILTSAGLAHILDSRLEVYIGPRLELLSGLTHLQRETIAELLGIELDQNLIVEEEEGLPEESEENEPEVIVPPVEEPILPFDPTFQSPVVEEHEDEIPQPIPAPEPAPEEIPMPTPIPENNGPVKPTYPGLVNQDLINLFYKVAAFFGENGWQWIIRSGLAAIGASRTARFEDYKGPRVKSIPGLSDVQREVLEKEINQLKAA